MHEGRRKDDHRSCHSCVPCHEPDHGATVHRNALCLPDSRAQPTTFHLFLSFGRWRAGRIADCAITFAAMYDTVKGVSFRTMAWVLMTFLGDSVAA